MFFEGKHYDAFSFARKLVKRAKKSIVLVDGYCDEETLDILAQKKGAVKAIPGLWYRTQAYTTSACNDVEPGLGAAVQATGTTVTPVAPAFSGTVKYYKIRVAPSSNGI